MSRPGTESSVRARPEDEVLLSDLQRLGQLIRMDLWGNREVAPLIKALEKRFANEQVQGEMREAMRHLAANLSAIGWPAHRRLATRLAVLMRGPGVSPLDIGEAWSDAAIDECSKMDVSEQVRWSKLLVACLNESGSAPSKRFRTFVRTWLSEGDEQAILGRLLAWFALVDHGRTQPLAIRHHAAPADAPLMTETNISILRGLCWVGGMLVNPAMARAIGKVAISGYRKVPGVGARAVKVGNAAVYSLGQMPGPDALGQLAVLRVKVKFGTAQKGIEKALNAAAAREGLPREEIDELGVPSYGLTEVGRLSEQLGDVKAEIVIEGPVAKLVFSKLDAKGAPKEIKSVPASVKTQFAEELKELKAALKDINAMFPAQRDRIDAMFLDRKLWTLSAWRERYLDHPLVGTIARRLIWTFTDSQTKHAGVWSEAEGGLVDVQGKLIEPGPTAAVAMWHPVEATQDEVRAWRRFFEEREIKQPFKQAHREVYLLTDAERRTNTYSNRFAAHILKQHQFNALCGIRGWKNKLRLMVDDEYPPAARILRAYGLRAEFWIEGAGDEYGRDTNETGVFLHLTTDQVRFYPIDGAQLRAHAGGGGYGGPDGLQGLALDQIPPLVLSEVLRDVDLFVGVCSVANNPQWSDGGPQGTYRNYWWNYGFGDLGGTGSLRRDLLQRLVPRLKIAAQCTFEDKFLVVKGRLRTYKIHLGSGNILMQPNDQYLCIVPTSRDETSSVFLPFEGDRTLSIILSKAFMLAEDDQIKDPSITHQIKGS